MKKISIFAALLSLLVFVACDSGNIYPKEISFEHDGLVAKLTGEISGFDQWPEEYDLVLAAFGKDSPYSIVQKHVSPGSPLVLDNISPQASTIELAIVDRLRERIVTLDKVEVTDAMRKNERDTLRLEVNKVDAGMFSTLKRVVFVEKGECSRCHGHPDKAAAGMSLLPEHAYAALVNHTATVDPTQTRVVPGDADHSFLVRVLTPGNGGLTHYADHPNILNNEQDLKYFKLLKDWINHGAKE